MPKRQGRDKRGRYISPALEACYETDLEVVDVLKMARKCLISALYGERSDKYIHLTLEKIRILLKRSEDS